MGFSELLLIAVGLSMDAFAVAVCKGLKMRRLDIGKTAVIALFFGGFQALMPLLGWALGKQFERYITSIDHWIAFVLLAVIGANMIKESFSKEEECPDASFGFKTMLTLAVATSIDALAVGVTFAFLDVSIVPAVLLIGATTFVCSAVGVKIGNVFGNRFQSKAEFLGGLVLIAIGLKILIEHLFFGG